MNTRQKDIMALLEQRGEITVRELASRFNVSEMTIYRDIDLLEAGRYLTKKRGAAVYANAANRKDDVFYADEKRSIGKIAADLIKPGMSVLFDNSTTALEVARFLDGIPKLTFYTTNLETSLILSRYPNTVLYCSGGYFNPNSTGFTGQLTMDFISKVHADVCIVGISGISTENGLTVSYPSHAMQTSAILKAAKTKIVVADHSKFGRVAMEKAAELSDVDIIVTDGALPAQTYIEYSKHVRIIRANDSTEDTSMNTYCNPLSVADIKSGRWLDAKLTKVDPRDYNDYRSISDPSVVYHNGKWILYPSYSVAYVSEDFIHWKHVDIGVPHLNYSPAVVQFRGKWYLIGHGMTEMYVADEPTGPFEFCGHMTDVHGNPIATCDGCFLADGDRLYYYWCKNLTASSEMDVESLIGTAGVELDPDKPWQMITEPVMLNRFDPSVKWQRMGEHNQNERMGWIEGPWMYKKGSRYYLLYSGCGTEYGAYTSGIMYSDEGPLTGFKPQKNHDPFTEKRTGLMRGSGHGCIVDGPNNTIWTFYTCIFCYNYLYERRIGMDPVGIDEDGELYCTAVTEFPQLAPGVNKHPEKGNDTGWLPLTFMQRPTASSCVCGREPLYASDDSVLTWWQPAADDKEPTITFRLGSATRYEVNAIRLIWRDIGMETLDGIMPGAFRYVIEYASNKDMKEWETLIDASENTEDLCIDYRETKPVQAYGVRLRILGAPKGITPGLVSLTAFGSCIRENIFYQ